jgi:hypothetical protein
MPIRINLKELFSADSQSIVIDKINFNFNKLLELGVGEIGERGFSGIQGAAGPIGLTGEQGIRGATWFVDPVADPNTLTFQDLLEGDLYLDSTRLAIWQYDGTQWNFVVDLTNVINSYLTASPSPFKRGFGIGPDDNRFILFNKRDDVVDNTLGSGTPPSPSQNDILFLNNYDEDAIIPFNYGPAVTPTGFQTDTSDYYNSLLAISVDHRAVQTGRYHMEMGTLYNDGSVDKLSTVYENLKIRFTHEQSSVHAGINSHSLGIFSLDLPELSPNTNRTSNGIFKFISSKFLPLADNDTVITNLGSRYGFDEIVNNGSGYVGADGILVQSNSVFANIGVIENYAIPNYPSTTGYVANTATNDYMWLKSINANGIIIDDSIFQNGGNIIQLGTTVPRTKATITSQKGASNSSNFFASGAITILGNEVYTGFGDNNIYNNTVSDLSTKYGYFNKFSISDPNNPTSDFNLTSVDYIKFNGAYVSPASAPGCNQAYQLTENPIGPGLKDITSDGEYIYAVNSKRLDVNPGGSVGGVLYAALPFQILRKNNKNGIGLSRVSALIASPEINGASRIKLYGKYAIITTGTLLGWNTPLDISGTGYDGKITAIDISDPTNPRIETSASLTPTKTLVSPSTTALMDLDIIDDYAFVVTWEQKAGSGVANIQIRFDVFDLSGLKRADPSLSGTITWIGRGQTNIQNYSAVNSGFIQNLPKTAAITTDGRYVYVGYSDTVYKYSFNTLNGTRSGTSPNCFNQYPLQESKVLTSIGSRKIVDMKVLGNSLYVLLSDSSDGQFVKFEIRNSLTQVYSTALTGQPVSRFENSGKHFYIACQNTGTGETNARSLIVLDFDGFYTGGAHIESLRADEINISKDAKIGGSLNVATSLTVGSGAKIQGHLGVEQAIQVPYVINDEGDLVLRAGGTGRDVNIIASDDITATANDTITLTANNDVVVNASDTFDAGANTIDMYSNLNTIINAGGATSKLGLYSGKDVEIIPSDRFDVFCPNVGSPQSQISADSTGDIYIAANSQLQLQSNGTAPANYNTPANFPLKIFGHLSASGAHTTQIGAITPTQPAIISGTFNPLPNEIPNDTSGASIMHWQKIGNIISVTGIIAFSDDNSSSLRNGLVPFPLKHTLYPISNVYGTATIETDAGSTMIPAVIRYNPIVSFGKFYFEFRGSSMYGNSAGVMQAITYTGGYTVPTTVVRITRDCEVHFTMSYRLG